MKKIFYTIIISSLILGCGPKKVTCIKYPENTTETCTPTYKLLQNKEWVLDSVIFNGQNITAQTLAQVKDYSFIISDQDQNYTGSSNVILRSAQVFFNDSSFKFQYVSYSYNHTDGGITLTPMDEQLSKSINRKERPFILGLTYNGFDWDEGENSGIFKLENNSLKYSIGNKNKDSISINYFHSN